MEENANLKDFPYYSELSLGHAFWILKCLPQLHFARRRRLVPQHMAAEQTVGLCAC